MLDPGTKVTVTRGKHKGKAAEILSPADPEGQHAVKLDNGTVAVVSASSLKAPDETTIGEGRLASEIQTGAGDFRDSPEAQAVLQALVSRLSGDMPGLGARIEWPAERDNDTHRA